MKRALLIAAVLLSSLCAHAETLHWNSWEMHRLQHLMGAADGVASVRQLQPLTTEYARFLLSSIESDQTDVGKQARALREEMEAGWKELGPLRFRASLFSSAAHVRPDAVKILELPAFQNPFLAKNEGAFVDGGTMGMIGFRVAGEITDYFSFDASPAIRFSSENTSVTDHASFYLREGLASFRLRRLSIEGGRTAVIWGTGRYGRSLFSGDNQAFPLVRIRSSQPIVPPSFLKFMGPTQFEAFMGLMDGSREFPHARLVGTVLSFAPHSRIEITLGQTVMFGGSGSPGNNPLLFFTEKLSDVQNPANRNFLAAGRWKIPKIDVEVYTDLMVEDCCAANFFNLRDTMNLAGFTIPNLGPEAKGDLSLEWVRTDQVTYRHNPFASGYTYQGRLLGHPVGPDALGAYAIYRHFHSPRVAAQGLFAYEERGRIGENIGSSDIRLVEPTFQKLERRYRFETIWQVKVGAWSFSPRGGIERIHNYGYQQGQSRWGALAELQLETRL